MVCMKPCNETSVAIKHGIHWSLLSNDMQHQVFSLMWHVHHTLKKMPKFIIYISYLRCVSGNVHVINSITIFCACWCRQILLNKNVPYFVSYYKLYKIICYSPLLQTTIYPFMVFGILCLAVNKNTGVFFKFILPEV
jgi:hypothetical protein